ncbi:MAG: hypothetical protein ACI3Y0_12825 [Prevotella sp.]
MAENNINEKKSALNEEQVEDVNGGLAIKDFSKIKPKTYKSLNPKSYN